MPGKSGKRTDRKVDQKWIGISGFADVENFIGSVEGRFRGQHRPFHVQDCFTRFLDKHAPSLGQIDDSVVTFKEPEAELMQ
jgi:hypothetical protein